MLMDSKADLLLVNVSVSFGLFFGDLESNPTWSHSSGKSVQGLLKCGTEVMPSYASFQENILETFYQCEDGVFSWESVMNTFNLNPFRRPDDQSS